MATSSSLAGFISLRSAKKNGMTSLRRNEPTGSQRLFGSRVPGVGPFFYPAEPLGTSRVSSKYPLLVGYDVDPLPQKKWKMSMEAKVFPKIP